MRDRKSPGRPREFDETEALRKIMSLFWAHGFEGVSLSQIMTATELKKASLYAAFGDKRSMYLKALQQYHADQVREAAHALQDPAKPPLDRIRAFLTAPLAAIDRGDHSGCFLCNASADQAALDTDTQAQVQQGFATLAKALQTPLQRLHPELDSGHIASQAHMLLGLYSGFRIMARGGVDVVKLGAGIDVALSAVR